METITKDWELHKARTPSNSRFAVVYPLNKFWELLNDEYQTTGQITKKMGCSGDLTYLRLCELFNKGRASRIRAGNIWLWKKVEIQ